jgi:hypothetical protein
MSGAADGRLSLVEGARPDFRSDGAESGTNFPLKKNFSFILKLAVPLPSGGPAEDADEVGRNRSAPPLLSN